MLHRWGKRGKIATPGVKSPLSLMAAQAAINDEK